MSTKIGLKSNKLCRKGRTVLIEKKRGGLVKVYIGEEGKIQNYEKDYAQKGEKG